MYVSATNSIKQCSTCKLQRRPEHRKPTTTMKNRSFHSKTAQNPQSKSPGITRQIIWNCTLQKMSKTQTFFLAEGAMSVTDNTQFHIKSSHTRNITQQEANHAPKLGSIQTLTPTHTTKLLRQTTHTASSIITSSKPPIDSLRHLSNHDSPHQNHIPTDPPQGTSKTSTPTQWQQSMNQRRY